MTGTKTTIYLPEELRKTGKKHLIDTGETLSKYVEIALTRQLAFDKTRAGKRRLKEKQKAVELNNVIKEFIRGEQ